MKKTHLVEEQTKYIWWKDKKIFGIILLFLTFSFQIFAFLEIPIMTSLHGYTIGMLFGFYNPLFYIFVAYIALLLISNNKLFLPKWLKLKFFTYWIMVVSILFISASAGYYQVKNGWFVFGSDSWLSFSKWFTDFTSKNNALIPANTNGGVIGVFLYSFFSMIFTGIGAFVVAIISILIPASLLFTGTISGLYLKIIRKKMLYKSKKEFKNKKHHNKSLDDTLQSKIVSDVKDNNQSQFVKDSQISNHEEPFDDPFN